MSPVEGGNFSKTSKPIGSHRLRRGGANNKADRITFNLTRHQCRRMLASVDQAFEQGLPYNRYITIAWGLSGADRKSSVKLTGEWIALCRDWSRQQGYKLSWAWVQEHGPIYGAHCHILLHVPKHLDHVFKARPTAWTRHVLNRHELTYVAKTVQSQKVAPLFLPYSSLVKRPNQAPSLENDRQFRRRAYLAGVSEKVHYMLKCAPEALEDELGLTGAGFKEWGQECAVFGKRLATWQFP